MCIFSNFIPKTSVFRRDVASGEFKANDPVSQLFKESTIFRVKKITYSMLIALFLLPKNSQTIFWCKYFMTEEILRFWPRPSKKRSDEIFLRASCVLIKIERGRQRSLKKFKVFQKQSDDFLADPNVQKDSK